MGAQADRAPRRARVAGQQRRQPRYRHARGGRRRRGRLFIDFEGLLVHDPADIDAIEQQVESLWAPLGRRGSVVATTRLRLEAVIVKTRQDPATLVGLLQASDVEAAGDAAGDLLGIDIGL